METALETSGQETRARRLETFRAPLHAFLFRLTKDYHLAQDLAQEALLRAWRAREEARVPHRFRGWLFRVAYHAAVDHARRRGPRPIGLEAVGDCAARPEPARRRAPTVILDGRERDRASLLRAVRSEIGRLRPSYRRILEARYLEDRTCREIAETEGISLGNVKIRLLRARRLVSEAVRARLLACEPPRRGARGRRRGAPRHAFDWPTSAEEADVEIEAPHHRR